MLLLKMPQDPRTEPNGNVTVKPRLTKTMDGVGVMMGLLEALSSRLGGPLTSSMSAASSVSEGAAPVTENSKNSIPPVAIEVTQGDPGDNQNSQAHQPRLQSADETENATGMETQHGEQLDTPDRRSFSDALVLHITDHNVRRLKDNLFSTKGAELGDPKYLAAFEKAKGTLKSIKDLLALVSTTYSVHQCGMYMAGRKSEPSDTVALRPCVVISCPNKKAFRTLHMRLNEMEWTRIGDGEFFKSDSLSTVQVYYGGARLAAFGSPEVDIPNLNESQVPLYFQTPDKSDLSEADLKLHIHVESPNPLFDVPHRCGLICCATITRGGATVHQAISRFGGLLFINNTLLKQQFPVGVTTAHGMIEYLFQQQTEVDDDGSDSDDRDEEFRTRSPATDLLGYVDVAKIRSWIPVEPKDIVSFVEGAREHYMGVGQVRFVIRQSSELRKASDVSLLDVSLSREPDGGRTHTLVSPTNPYFDSQLKLRHVEGLSTTNCSPGMVSSGAACVLLRPGEKAVEAEVLPNRSSVFILGREFEAEELWLPSSLSTYTSTFFKTKNQFVNWSI
jgi:hypothetical protein